MVVGKHLIFQKVIVSYLKDADNDIMLTMNGNEMKVCMDVYGRRWLRLTRFEPGTVRKTEVMADRTISDKWTDGNYSLFP